MFDNCPCCIGVVIFSFGERLVCQMALVLPGAMPALSGKVGGQVFARNRGGAYVRSRVNVVNPNTPLQQAVRGYFGQLAGQWYNFLTADERDSWTNWAAGTPRRNRIGGVIFLSGNSAFVGANTLRKQLQLPTVNEVTGPNLLALMSAPGTLTISAAPKRAILSGISVDDEWNQPGGALGLYISKPQNPTVEFFKGPYQLAGKLTGGTVGLTAGTITFSQNLVVGMKTFYRLASSAPDGRPSQTLADGVITI